MAHDSLDTTVCWNLQHAKHSGRSGPLRRNQITSLAVCILANQHLNVRSFGVVTWTATGSKRLGACSLRSLQIALRICTLLSVPVGDNRISMLLICVQKINQHVSLKLSDLHLLCLSLCSCRKGISMIRNAHSLCVSTKSPRQSPR